MCDWSILSPSSPLAVTLPAFSSPPLSGLTITSQFHLLLHSLLCLLCMCACAFVCKHILALSCGPGRTPNGKRFYHYVWLAISLHISSTLADRASYSITLLPLGPTIQRHTFAHTETQTQSQSHSVASCQSGQMSHP